MPKKKRFSLDDIPEAVPSDKPRETLQREYAEPEMKLPPDIEPADLSDQRASQVEVLDLLEAVAEKAKRQIEALNLYESLPAQQSFHDGDEPLRLLRGSNRSGKTLTAAVEFARAVLGKDPKNRYPTKDGRGYIVGKDLKHMGEVIYRKLFMAGAFKIIRDEVTGLWRAFRPWSAADVCREKQAKPAPPLIPPRFVKGISWEKKSENIPSKIRLTNGWEINFLSSLGKPPHGMDLDLVWFDEEIVDSDWFSEMMARLPDREGKFWWSATPQAGTERLLEFHLRCEAEAELFRQKKVVPTAREYVILIKDNPHIKDIQKRLMEQSLTDTEKQVRVDGDFAIHGRKVYPEFRKPVHLVKYFDIPSHWSNYLIVDPGRQICAALLASIPPPNEYENLEFACVLRDELYIPNCDAEEFAKEAKRMCDGLHLEKMVIDIHGARITEMGSGKTVIEQYQDALEEVGVKCAQTGSQFSWGDDDVKGGVEAFRSLLKVRKEGRPSLVAIEDKTPNFVWEIERYRYKLNKGEITDEPETRGRVHLMACARYLVMCDPVWVKPQPGRSAGGMYELFLQKMRKEAARRGPSGVNLGPSRSG